jgi:transposase
MELNGVYRRVHFRKWQQTGLWEQILDALVVKESKLQTRQESPSLLDVDSQTVKTLNFVSLDTGIDGAKKLSGRKRHLAVDTLGLQLATLVIAASVSDKAAGLELWINLRANCWSRKDCCRSWLQAGCIDYVHTTYPWRVETAQRLQAAYVFILQKNFRPVERSFGWLNFQRRLAKDYEKIVVSSLAVLQIAFILFLSLRLAK